MTEPDYQQILSVTCNTNSLIKLHNFIKHKLMMNDFSYGLCSVYIFTYKQVWSTVDAYGKDSISASMISLINANGRSLYLNATK